MPPRRLLPLIMLVMILAIFMSGGRYLHAQKVPYIYLHLDQEDGLASNDVLAILQDKKGFLWFGTNNGLQRYDGRQFIHYRYDSRTANSLGSDIVEALFEDKKGELWVASAGTVTRFNPTTNQFTRIRLPEHKGNCPPLGSHFREDEKGQIRLLACNGRQGFLYQTDHKAFVPVAGLPFANLDSTYSAYLAGWKSNEAYVYLKDSRGIVWAGSEKLLALPPGASGFEPVPEQAASRYGIQYNRIFALTEDREGTIWVGTDKGVYYFNPDKQRFFSAPIPHLTGSSGFVPTDFMQDQNNKIWVSTVTGEILVYDTRLDLVNRHLSVSSRQPVWCLVQDHTDIIWGGTAAGMLLKIDPAGRINYLHPPLLSGQTITKAALDTDSTIWLGTDQGQVFNFDPCTERLTALQLDQPGRGPGRIVRILPQQPGYLWVAAAGGGVFKLDKKTAAVVDHYNTSSRPYALPSNQVGDMQWVDSTTLAVSTIAGLGLLDVTHKTGKTFTTVDGLPANALINVIPARNNHFYITPQNGLSQWNAKTGRLTTFGPRDGLPDAPFPFNASYRLADGRIVLGTINGFFYFHPDSLVTSRPPADVLITGVKIFDKPVELDSATARDGSLRLHHDQNFFTIEYASLSYYDDKQISYFYQLEGVDPDWVAAGSNRFANYTNIEGGNYRFQVKAERADGTSTVHEATLAIHISRPFWQTWWFRVMLLVALAGVGAGIYRIRIDRVLALQRMRMQISRDLHDDIGSTLSTINILSAMARRQAGRDIQQTEGHLEKISNYSQRMMDAMDDIVWSVNPANDAAQNLVARMRSFCLEALEPKGIAFTFEVDEASASVRLPLAVKHNCFMIFKEAVNNASKYARCNSVVVSLHLHRKQLILSIRDDGAGFDVNQASEGNGLLNMQARATAMKGRLQILSSPGSGTTVVLQAPFGGA